METYGSYIILCDAEKEIFVVRDGAIDRSRGRNGRLGRAESWRYFQIVSICKGNLVFIDYEERTRLRKIDLNDFSAVSTELSVFMSNVAVAEQKALVFALSAVCQSVTCLHVEISSFETERTVKIADAEGSII